jgi:hypothetical protein
MQLWGVLGRCSWCRLHHATTRLQQRLSHPSCPDPATSSIPWLRGCVVVQRAQQGPGGMWPMVPAPAAAGEAPLGVAAL